MATNLSDNNNTSFEHDTTSEAGSDTLSSQRIYTPTSSVFGTESESHDREDEVALTDQAPLLFEAEQTPVDEKRDSTPVHATIEVESDKEPEGKGETVDIRGRGCSQERGCGRQRFWVYVKAIMLLGVVFWLYGVFEAFFTTPRNHRQICHGCIKNKETLPHNREIVVDHGHDSIWGKYPLFDLLSLSTSSGNIDVTVMPQPADPRKPDEPARLRIRSGSGSVTVSFTAPAAASLPEKEAQMGLVEYMKPDDGKTTHSRGRKMQRDKKLKKWSKSECKQGKGSCACKDKTNSKSKPKSKCKGGCHHHHQVAQKKPKLNSKTLPARPYEIEIETESGVISGRFVFSTSVRLSTTSGAIEAVLVPIVFVSDGLNQDVSVVTQSSSGSQHIHLTEPAYAQNLSQASSSFSSSVQANHTSRDGGSMQITYPPQWAGTVHAEPDSGSVSLAGPGLKVTRKEDGSVEGSKDGRDGEGGKWWGARGGMDVALDTRGAVMFIVG